MAAEEAMLTPHFAQGHRYPRCAYSWRSIRSTESSKSSGAQSFHHRRNQSDTGSYETVLQEHLPDDKLAKILLDSVDLTKFSADDPNVTVKVDELAYVIYTLGSTGQPKGVMIQHQAIAAAIDSIISFESRDNERHKTLQFSNYTFDASVYDIFVPLGSGHTLCMAPTDRLLSDLANVINEMDVTHCLLTPTVARLLDPKDAPSLKALTVGGESITTDVVEKWSQGPHTLIGAYGPTETSIIATMNIIDLDTNPKDIGRPLPTVKAFIIEQDGHRLVPLGAIGEICLAGPQLGNGYLGKPAQTAAVFLESRVEGVSRIYRTGDLGRWLPNGNIECLGRKDNQIKIHGYRVELGEVEQAMLNSPSVRDAVVVLHEKNGKTQLIAFAMFSSAPKDGLSSPEGSLEELKTLRESLGRLAHYMVPFAVIPLGSMPRLPSGKTNRRELKAMVDSMSTIHLSKYGLNSSGDQGSIATPETKEQKILQQAWAAVLAIDSDAIGLESDFLSLGGDSIGAINLASRLRKEHYSLSVGQALACTKLENMAACMKYSNEGATLQKIFETPLDVQMAFEYGGLQRKDYERIYPCPPGQAEFLSQGAREEQYWTVMIVRRFAALADMDTWIELATKLAETNEILRTTFVERHSEWYGAVLKDATPVIAFEAVDDQADKEAILEKVWQQRFTTGQPYLKYVVMCKPDGSKEIIIKMGHALYDGTLLHVFDDHFKNIQRGQQIPDYTPFHEFATHIWSSNKSRALEFWTDSNQRPTAFQYPRIENPAIEHTHVHTTNLQLDAYATKTGQTPSIIFKAAYQIWLALQSGSHDASFDYLYTGRNVDLPNPQFINGTCANFLPLRSQIESE